MSDHIEEYFCKYNWTDEQMREYQKRVMEAGALALTIMGRGPCPWTPMGVDPLDHAKIIEEVGKMGASDA